MIGHSEAVAVVTDERGAPPWRPSASSSAPAAADLDRRAAATSRWHELAGRGNGTPSPGRGLDDLAAILYTSGTTGKPKGAMLTHRNELVNTTQGAELVPLAAGERVGMLLPLFHANAQVVTTLIPMMIGCEVVMWEQASPPRSSGTRCAEFEPVTISAVPTILAAVLNAPGAPEGENSLRYVICGAAPLSVELLTAFQERFGIRILEGYGLTETGCIASINPFYGERKAGSIGLPLRGTADADRRRGRRAWPPPATTGRS